MGVFNDYRTTNRDTWRFVYLGKDLAEAAERKYFYFADKERAARTEMASLLNDVNVRASDPKIESLKQDIEKFGTEGEKCAIWASEFERQSLQEYQLSLGDVSFFGLYKNPEK